MDEDFFRFDPEDDDEDLDNAAPFGEDEDTGYDGYRDGLPLVSSRLPDEDDEAFDDEPEDEVEEPELEEEVEEDEPEEEPELEEEVEEDEPEEEPELEEEAEEDEPEDEAEEPELEDEVEEDEPEEEPELEEEVEEDEPEEEPDPEDEESEAEEPNPEESKEEQPAISSDLIRGHINTIILRSLYDGDKYGYEIIAEIEHKSHGQYTLKQPSLYSALKRLEKDGYITSYWGGSVSGGRRKYFSLTDEGKEIAERNQTEWEYSRTVIDSLISDKAFDFSEPAPAAVDMRVLKQSTSRVPDRDDEEYDGEEYEQSERDDLEARRAAFEEERARYEESLRVREEVLRAREEAGTKREQELLEREFALAGEERKREEEAEQRRLEEEEAQQRRLEEEAEQRRLEEEAQQQRRLEEEAQQQRRLEEEAQQRRLEEEAAERQRLEEEAAERQRLEEEAAEQQRLEQEAEQRRLEEEAEQRRLEEEAEQRRLEEEAAEQQRLEEEAAEQQRLEEEERRRAAGETLFNLSDVDRARAVSLSREKEEQNARIREMEPFAEERARYEQRLRDQEEEFLAMHERELAEQEARIREEDEKLFRRREQQIIHQNYLNLVNGGQDEPPVGNNSYYYEPQPSAEDYAYVSKPEAEREYRSIIRRLYNGAVPQEEESAPLPAPEPAPVEASAPAPMPAPMPTPAPAPAPEPVPAPRVHETEEKQEKEEKPAPRVHAGRRLDGVDFYDLESLAAQDGIRISTSGGRRKEPEPRSESLVHRGKALFFSALVVFLLCLAEGSIALGFQSRLKLPAFYPYFIWGTGTALLLVTFLMYINHFGERSLRRTGNLLINVIVAYALCVIVILIVALTAKADFTDIGQLMTYVILPAIYFFSIVVFGIAYYLQVRPLNE